MSDEFILGIVFGVGITVGFIVTMMTASSMSAENACRYAHQVEECERKYVPVLKGQDDGTNNS